ncbi:MAG: Site-specific recombinase [Firmicutes bacterium]|nr:Site-specific recombinase [Bacillota bacterium]MDI6706312.1 recombinase family protein [Bacillota bacterium]
MKTATVINPKEVSVSEEKKRLKVAAYCRVSTEYEEQISSLKSQVAHFSKLIQDNPNWEFAGIYAEQESGTNVENRDELNRMLKDCEKGKIDLILTKSLSRFSRNRPRYTFIILCFD